MNKRALFVLLAAAAGLGVVGFAQHRRAEHEAALWAAATDPID